MDMREETAVPDAHAAVRRALLREKIHLASIHAPRRVPGLSSARGAPSAWSLALTFASRLSVFPIALLQWWLSQPTGHAVIGGETSFYQAGTCAVKRRSLVNVVWVAPSDLQGDRARVYAALAGLFDHLLGCGGAETGEWLSEGGGIDPGWQRVGQRILERFRLGYAPPAHASTPRSYFAWAVALYCTDRQGLTIADPLIARLLHTTLMDQGYWDRR